jgi:hypothetical protein
MTKSGRRYVFSGHAVGVAAQFDRLGKLHGLNHVIPTLGSAALPVTGGLSQSEVPPYNYAVDKPWNRSLISVQHVVSTAQGTLELDGYRTVVHAKVEGLSVVEKLHIGLVEFNLSSTRKGNRPPVIRTTGNHIEGMRLRKVEVTVDLDDETLAHCGTKQQLADFYARQDEDFRQRFAWRFGTRPGAPAIQDHNGYYRFSLVREIKLSGPKRELARIPRPRQNKIVWPGFGRIFLGEVLVGDNQRRMTMVRLDMGSDAGGSGSVGDGSTNGSVST